MSIRYNLIIVGLLIFGITSVYTIQIVFENPSDMQNDVNAFSSMKNATTKPNMGLVAITDHNISTPEIIAPLPGKTIGGLVTIRWEAANDSWGHNITYSVSYMVEGSIWRTLESELLVTEYIWDTSLIDNGSNCYLAVVATCSEGLSSNDYTVSPYLIVDHAFNIPELKSPLEGEIVGKSVIIQWYPVIDPVGHDVVYLISYSPDNGSKWVNLIDDLSETEYLWNTTSVDNGTNCILSIEVSCSDGLHQLFIFHGSFLVINEPRTTTTAGLKTTTRLIVITTTTNLTSAITPWVNIYIVVLQVALMVICARKKAVR